MIFMVFSLFSLVRCVLYAHFGRPNNKLGTKIKYLNKQIVKFWSRLCIQPKWKLELWPISWVIQGFLS